MKKDKIEKEMFFYTKHDSKAPKLTTREQRTAPRRGVIAAVLVGDELRYGRSECSHKDQFVRVVGRGIAKGRAIKSPIHVEKLKDATQLTEQFNATADLLLAK